MGKTEGSNLGRRGLVHDEQMGLEKGGGTLGREGETRPLHLLSGLHMWILAISRIFCKFIFYL